MEITWIGWDCFKVKTSGKTIYFDPVFGTYDEPGDIVLISHSHSDHTNINTLAKIRKPGTVVLTSNENKDAVKGIGLAPGQSHTIDAVRVTARHAYNLVKGPKPGAVFHPKGFGLGWIVEADGTTLYHLGDTELIPEMKGISNIDIMIIPISGFYVMDIDEAVETVKLIRPKLVIPMHFDVVDADPENQPDYNLYADPQEFAGKLEGIAEVRVMNHGETIRV
ncbi:MAG: MBL fold metallo-hydrolase [Bacteroidetes bacterium]|nr:MBL fold metallo-hydrolase [Bacteroidota bacterium]